MYEIVHISRFTRSSQHLGGVEKYGMYLGRIFPELECVGVESYLPNHALHQKKSEWVQAEMLNTHLLEDRQIGIETTVITDGLWGTGLVDKVARLICVCHGSYVGVLAQHQIYPWGADEDWLVAMAAHQEAIYRQADVVVAVSMQAARELDIFYDIEATVIPQMCDLDIFVPPPRRGVTLLEAAGADPRKGASMLAELREMFPIEHLNVRTGQNEDEARRWQQGRVTVLPTHYEGAAFATLESLACGVPVVGYRTGMLADLPLECGIIIDDYSVRSFARAIHCVMKEDFDPRPYVEQHHDVSVIAKQWRTVLGVAEVGV